jgi:AcrR family transcriptional regulator
MNKTCEAVSQDAPGPRRGRPPAALVPEREQKLLDETERLFIQYGYHHISIATIACTVRVATRTIYTRFGSKRGLLRALIERDLDGLRHEMGAIEQSGADHRQQLEALAYTLLRRTLSTPCARLYVDVVAERDDELTSLASSADMHYRSLLHRLLTQMPGSGNVSECEVKILGNAFMGYVLGQHIGVANVGLLRSLDRDHLHMMATLGVAAFLSCHS